MVSHPSTKEGWRIVSITKGKDVLSGRSSESEARRGEVESRIRETIDINAIIHKELREGSYKEQQYVLEGVLHDIGEVDRHVDKVLPVSSIVPTRFNGAFSRTGPPSTRARNNPHKAMIIPTPAIKDHRTRDRKIVTREHKSKKQSNTSVSSS